MKLKDEVKDGVNNGEQWYCSIIVIHKKENGMIISPWKKSQDYDSNYALSWWIWSDWNWHNGYLESAIVQ